MDFKEYLRLEHDNNVEIIKGLKFYYNPDEKEKVLKESYIPNFPQNTDKKKLIELTLFAVDYVPERKYELHLRNEKFPWLQQSIKKNKKMYLRYEKYLQQQKWGKREYFGKFYTNDLKTFLKFFILYPYENNYEDIFIYSKDKDCLLVLSDSGTVWVLNENRDYLKKLYHALDQKGATVKLNI